MNVHRATQEAAAGQSEDDDTAAADVNTNTFHLSSTPLFITILACLLFLVDLNNHLFAYVPPAHSPCRFKLACRSHFFTRYEDCLASSTINQTRSASHRELSTNEMETLYRDWLSELDALVTEEHAMLASNSNSASIIPIEAAFPPALMRFLHFSESTLRFHRVNSCSAFSKAGIEWLSNAKRCIVIAEGRKDFPFFIFNVRHLLYMLTGGQASASGWCLILLHSSQNEEWLVESLDITLGGYGERIHMQRVEHLTHRQANSLPLSLALLEDIIPSHVKYFLIYQADSIMLHSPLATPSPIESYRPSIDFETMLAQNFIYLGAPWIVRAGQEWQLYGGNGGTSLRRRDAMIDLLSEVRCDAWRCWRVELYPLQQNDSRIMNDLQAPSRQEDCFIAQRIFHSLEKYEEQWAPDQITMAQFSVERLEMQDVVPWFGHAIWKTLKQDRALHHLAGIKYYYPHLWRKN